ncbi:MAG: RimK family alpha-L-glutamate ligase [Bdellovibrionota bacterium]
MKIGIISAGQHIYSTRRLVEAAEERGHEWKVFDARECALHIEQLNPKIYYRNEELDRFDAIIPRIASNSAHQSISVLRQLELQGIYCINNSAAVSIASDKLRTLQILSKRNIGIPLSGFVYQKTDAASAIKRAGGAPVIVKLLDGTEGKGVILAESNKTALAIIETLKLAKRQTLIQNFVSESKGADIRAFVVGDSVIASMKRKAKEGEFRSNVHRGGSTELCQLSEEYEQTALRAAKIVGLGVAGVDMLETSKGPQVMEVNASPGLEGIEKCTGINIAGKIIEHIEEQRHFPDLDLNERLSLSKGFVICEIPVIQDTGFIGESIADQNFEQQEIQVLSIERQEHVIPNPPDDFQLLEGDVMLCYGKKAAIRALMT